MTRRIALATALMALVFLGTGPVVAAAPVDADTQIEADLEGVSIPVAAISKFYCNDFDYPAIHCFKTPGGLDAALSVEFSQSASSLDYVQVFENVNFTGGSMIISQNYDALWTISWNDKISSFKGKNSQTGHFWTDWFGGGSSYAFCCNQQVSSLGGFSDTFSSVYND